MFGRLRPHRDGLQGAPRRAFQEAYCGLCTELKSEHGRLSTLLLSYDLTFLFGLYTALGYRATVQSSPQGRDEKSRRCSGFPWRTVAVAGEPGLRALLSHLTLGLVRAKLEDDAFDDGSLSARLLLRAAKSRFDQAQARLAEAGFPVELLDRLPGEQAAREAQFSPHSPNQGARQALWTCGEPTAHLLEQTFDWLSRRQGHPTPLRQTLAAFGAALGRAVYYADCAQDSTDDQRKRRFNPLHLATTPHAQRQIQAAFQEVRQELQILWLEVRAAAPPGDLGQEDSLWPALEESLVTLQGDMELAEPETESATEPKAGPQKGTLPLQLLAGVRRRESRAAYYRTRMCGADIIEVLDYCCWFASSQREVKRREQEQAEEEARAAYRPPSIVGESTPSVQPADQEIDPALIPPLSQGPWTCPGCLAPAMERHPMGRGGFFSCATCRGVWLDPRHMGEVKKGMTSDAELAFARGAAPPSQKQGERVCPEDGETLDVVRRNGVTTDECPLCGGWFLDPGELAGFVR